MKRRKQPSLSSLEAKLDRVFSNYIRQRDADVGGTVRCVTCRRLLFWKEAHAGHFVKRQHRAVRWDERNVHAQCVSCNTYRGGQQDEYGLFIIRKYGNQVHEELLGRKHSVIKHTRADLQAMIDKYSGAV